MIIGIWFLNSRRITGRWTYLIGFISIWFKPKTATSLFLVTRNCAFAFALSISQGFGRLFTVGIWLQEWIIEKRSFLRRRLRYLIFGAKELIAAGSRELANQHTAFHFREPEDKDRVNAYGTTSALTRSWHIFSLLSRWFSDISAFRNKTLSSKVGFAFASNAFFASPKLPKSVRLRQNGKAFFHTLCRCPRRLECLHPCRTHYPEHQENWVRSHLFYSRWFYPLK